MSGVMDYSPREELANRLSHGAGLLLGIVGLVLLLIKGWGQGTQALVSYSLYGGSLVLLYPGSRYSPEQILARVQAGEFEGEGISALAQSVI